ncbi:MAG: hypothetical protein ABSB25_00290 [Sedimentisphaerales bacterium]|jgi:hypothetical protein
MAAIKTDGGQIGWRFGIRWVLLTVAGWTIGFPLGFVFVAVAGWIIGLSEGSDSIILKLGLDNAAVFIVVVAVVSLMQWFALRRVVQRAGFWVLASIIGFTIPSSIHGVVCHVYGYPDDLGPLGALVWTLFFILGGTLTGLLQQRILRHQVRRSGWWVPASAAGWGLVVIGFGIVSKILGVRLQVVGLIASSGLLGIVTGVTLIWLLRQPRQQTPRDTT